MKEGFPLFAFDSKNQNYNSQLVEEYDDGKQNLIQDYINEILVEKLTDLISSANNVKKDFKGFRMVL